MLFETLKFDTARNLGINYIPCYSIVLMCYNVTQLNEVAYYKAQTFKYKQMSNRSRNFNITTEPPILVRCYYVQFFFTNQ